MTDTGKKEDADTKPRTAEPEKNKEKLPDKSIIEGLYGCPAPSELARIQLTKTTRILDYD